MSPDTNFQAYFVLRENFISWGSYISVLLLIVGLVLLFTPWFTAHRRLTFLLSFSILSASFLFLVWYHFKVYQILTLPLPEQGTVRFCLPFWIEGEKLFFWSYLLAILLLISKPNQKIETWTYFSLGILTLASILFDRPFINPLPSFHQEISETSQVLKVTPSAQSFQPLIQLGLRAKYFYNTSYMWVHPPLIFFAYATFSYSFVSSLYSIFKSDQEAEEKAYYLIKIGYLALSAGLLIGYPWALVAWENEPWWWSPKINVSLMMWLFYTAYLHLRLNSFYRKNFRWLNCLNLLSFSSLLFTYITTYLMPGVHAYV